MLHLVVPSLKNKEKGFNLIEIAAILVIIGIAGAIGAPSLVNSRRQEQVNQAHSRIRSALVEAQINANRLSSRCQVRFGKPGESNVINGRLVDNDNELIDLEGNTVNEANSVSCLLEEFSYPSDIVSLTRRNSSGSNFSDSPQNVTFTFQGRTSNQTIWVARKDFNGDILPETAKCIVISNVGMIRTGIYDTSAPSNCRNIENDRYDSSTP